MVTTTRLEISLDPREVQGLSDHELGMLMATLDHWQELHVTLRKAALTEQMRRRRTPKGEVACSAY